MILNVDEIAISKIYQFVGYKIFMRNDHIVQLEFENGFSGQIEDGKNMVETIKKVKGPDKCLLLVIYKEDNTFSKENREYIASKEVSEVIKADALVIKGLALRIIGNGYLRINKPGRPTRLFNSRAEAITWLQQFML
ncbi:MAG: hypothetical protein V4506_14290 [Bacteroidota bacterium]